MLVLTAAGAAAGAALLTAPQLGAAWKFNSSDWTTVAVSLTPASQSPGPDGSTRFEPGSHPTISIIGEWHISTSCHDQGRSSPPHVSRPLKRYMLCRTGAMSAVFMVLALFLLVLLAWLDGRRRRRALERQRRNEGGLPCRLYLQSL